MAAFWLFAFQVVMAWIYMIPQVLNILEGKTGGLTLAMWFIFVAYLFLGLSLAVMAWKEKREWIRVYTVIIFAQWIVFILILFLMCVNTVVWSVNDTFVCVVVAILSALTIIRLGLKDPMARGWLAVWCKGTPQLYMAYTMWSIQSAEWIPFVSLMATNATCIPRLIQVYMQGSRGGWDRPTKGLMLGEAVNVATWLIVNLVWIILNVF